MVILSETTSTQDGARVLWIVAGPYWHWALLITAPIILASSAVVSLSWVDDSVQQAYWSVVVWTVLSLLAVSLSDPGMLPYFDTKPTESWIFSQQTKAYRPPGALYSRDCNVIIEDFDHTCFWVGTAIGKNNRRRYQVFVFSICVLLLTDLLIALRAAFESWSLQLAICIMLTVCALVYCSRCVASSFGSSDLQVGGSGSYGAIPREASEV